MDLQTFCRQITEKAPRVLPKEHPLKNRLICPEYSPSFCEIKTYPYPEKERIFLLYWNTDSFSMLHASMSPSPEAFRCNHAFKSGVKTQLHTHDYIELAYVVKGSFRQKILGRDITFEQGEFCLIDKNCAHVDYLFPETSIVLFIGISNVAFEELLSETTTPERASTFLKDALVKQKNLQQYLHFKRKAETPDDVEDILLQLSYELFEHQAGYRQISMGLLMRIFQRLWNDYDFFLNSEQKKERNALLFQDITDYIRENYNTITIQELCRKYHFQEDYFNRLIKKKLGMTYSAYVQKIRLETAERLLRTTSLSIDEIAETVGYHNKSFFYNKFKNKYGIKPGQYRIAKNDTV